MNTQSTPTELKDGKISKLLMQYAIPAIIATTAASLYNIIDRIFIGQGVGPLAISGLALTLPIMNLAAAFGAMVGVGASTMVSIRLGQRDKEGAALILGNAICLNIVLSISFSIVAILFLDEILLMLGASPNTLPYAKEFLQVILIGNIFTHVYLGLNNIMRASGYPQKSMLLTLLTVLVNIILAPLFIFVFKWGIQGAAAATVCAQIAGTIISIIHFMNPQNHVHFITKNIRLKLGIISDIISIGLSNFFMLICASLVVVIMNLSLGKFGGDFAIGSYGIINSIIGLFIMIVIGLNQGMQPIAGYNFGAQQLPRVFEVFKLTVIIASLVTTFGYLLCEIFPAQIASAFTSNPQLIDYSVQGMRLNMLVFPIVGFQMVASSFFQSVGRARISIILSLSRQVLFLIPILLILPHFWGLNGVWLAGPAADLCSSLLTLFMLRTQLKSIK